MATANINISVKVHRNKQMKDTESTCMAKVRGNKYQNTIAPQTRLGMYINQ
jgi:hypothetical protein